MEAPVLAAIAAAVFVAAGVQGVLGFGFGLVAVALIPLIVGVKAAVPMIAVFALAVNGVLVARFWRDVPMHAAAPLLGSAVVGLPLGVWLLRSLDPAVLFIALGVLVGGYVANTLLRREQSAELGATWGGALGFAAGVLGGAFTTPGPPAVVWVSSKPWSPSQLRATLFLLFGGCAALQLGLFVATDMLTRDALLAGAVGLPAGALGSLTGAKLGDRIDPAVFKKLMLIALAVVAVQFVIKGARGL